MEVECLSVFSLHHRVGAYRVRKRSNHVTMILDSANPEFRAGLKNNVETTETEA